jgi:glutathione S-transferase
MNNLTLVIGNKNYSSWSLRPWLAMKYFGLDFAEIKISLYQSDSLAQIKAYSPSGKVPVLKNQENIIWDSLAICEYLAETFPMFNWWGKTQTIKTLARCVSAEMHSGFLNLRQHMPMNCRRPISPISLTIEVQKDIQRITNIWQEYRQKFNSQGQFLFGDFTIADAFFAPVVLRFNTYAIPLDSISQEYVSSILTLEPLQQWIKDGRVEIESIPEFEKN